MSSLDEDVTQALTRGHVVLSDSLRGDILGTVGASTETEPQPYQLAQMNIARFLLPMDHPDMAGFVEMLDPLNHQADALPGCIWRLTGDGSNNATSLVFYDDPLLLVNMSVWTDLSSLRSYVYRAEHAEMLRRKAEWAVAMESRHMVLWWVPAGHIPDIAEGDARLERLKADGPTADAFTFGQAFPSPAG